MSFEFFFPLQLTLIELDMLKAIETHELVVYMWEQNTPGKLYRSCDTVAIVTEGAITHTRLYFLQRTSLIAKMLMLSSTDSTRYVVHMYMCTVHVTRSLLKWT